MNNHDENKVINENVNQSPVITDDDANRNLGVVATILNYFKTMYLDFIASFKYNKMKLAGILICVPGVIIGFFIAFHYDIIKSLNFEYVDPVTEQKVVVMKDLSALCFFLMMLFGTLNLFTGVSCMGKKNLGSVINSTITSSFICIFVAVYFFHIFKFYSLQQQGLIELTDKFSLTSTSSIMVFLSCGLSVICSVVGVILGFKNYDRNFNKRDAR
jgi:hypothetical protein